MAKYNDIIKQELEAAKAEIQEKQKLYSKWASGATGESLTVGVEADGHGTLSAPAYFDTLQQGRKAGKVPMYFKEIIKRWAITKGLSFGSEAELDNFASAVEWKTRRLGSRMHREGVKVDLVSQAAKSLAERTAKRIHPLLAIEVLNYLKFDK